jgi:RNA-directed DNA polymerase
MASDESQTLACNLMEQICERRNLNRAYKRVKANKGAGGVDGMTIDELLGYLQTHKEELTESLLQGTYQPQAVRGVKIPKPGGGERQLGIPTVVDRVVQQAIAQVLEPIFELTFSGSSYGFRPGRSAHQALKRAGKYVAEGNVFVVDIDLEKFFDRVNHDILMSRLARRIGDKHLLRIIRRFLTAGIMQDGVCSARQEGTPQGGPLSPLLSNILLDELDKELERRGHKFCRYADDCNIYVRSRRAGERVLLSIKAFLWNKLRLRVNEEKSASALVRERKFLGYTIRTDGQLKIATESIKRMKNKIRMLTKRNRGISIEEVIKQLTAYLRGWINYFQLSASKSVFQEMDAWIRRRLRSYRLKQKKRSYPIARWLISLGIQAKQAWQLAKSSKGWWRLSRTPTIHSALPNAWFKEQGLISLFDMGKAS